MTTWTEIRIQTIHEAVEPICHLLYEANIGGVVIEDANDLTKQWDTLYGELYELSPDHYPKEGVRIKAYIPKEETTSAKVAMLKKAIHSLTEFGIDIGPADIELLDVFPKDWEKGWKKYYKPVAITKGLTIVPTWESYTKKEGETVIRLDPGMAFGTGTHPSTLLAIQALEQSIVGGERLIDVGTGSGILSIVSAILGVERVLALDLDRVAVTSAERNIALNQLDDIITVKENDLLRSVDERANIVVANILAHIIIDLAKDAACVLESGGLFITSGIIYDKKDEVKEALHQHEFTVQTMLQQDDWIAFIAKKR